MSIKIENTEISGWKAAIRGARNSEMEMDAELIRAEGDYNE